jgi:hypothetical protein
MFERSPRLGTALAVLAAAAAVSYFVFQTARSNRRPEGTIWVYDLKTRSLFPASDVSVPPIDTKSGPGMGVRAYVYAPEDDPTNRFIAFLETLTPDTKQEIEGDLKKTGTRVPIGFAIEKRVGGILVSSPEPIEWRPKFSPEGMEIMEAGKRKGGTDRIRPCLP